MLVAQTRGLTGHSAILRTMSLDQVMVEYHRLFELFSQEAA